MFGFACLSQLRAGWVARLRKIAERALVLNIPADLGILILERNRPLLSPVYVEGRNLSFVWYLCKETQVIFRDWLT